MIFRLNEKATDFYHWTIDIGYTYRKGLLLLQAKPGELLREFLVYDPKYSLKGTVKGILGVGP